MKRRRNSGNGAVKSRLSEKGRMNTYVNPVTNKVQKKTVLSEANFLAAELHQLRVVNLDLRKQILGKNAQVLKLQQALVERDERLLAMEEKVLEDNNTSLREKHGLRLGETLHKDDKTNEVYYLDEIDGDQDAHEDEDEDEEHGSEG